MGETSPIESRDEVRVHRALGDPSRTRILAALREADHPLDAHALAERVGLHPNTVRSHLGVLVEVGLVSAQAEKRTRPGRPRIVYEPTIDAQGSAEPGGYRLLAQVLASYLAGSEPDARERAEEAGKLWGRHLVERPAPLTSLSASEGVDRVVRLLDELGFRPQLEVDEDGYTVLMRRCPFDEVAGAYGQVVCQVHLGLVRGALEETGVSVGADWLEPHRESHECVVHLLASGEAHGG
jgi:predicted ArsR family transcriptional regulator